MRGLKFDNQVKDTYVTNVAPYAGAWIEIDDAIGMIPGDKSHPTRVRGLKYKASSLIDRHMGRTLRGCVD